LGVFNPEIFTHWVVQGDALTLLTGRKIYKTQSGGQEYQYVYSLESGGRTYLNLLDAMAKDKIDTAFIFGGGILSLGISVAFLINRIRYDPKKDAMGKNPYSTFVPLR
jgi:hypothetical protein